MTCAAAREAVEDARRRLGRACQLAKAEIDAPTHPGAVRAARVCLLLARGALRAQGAELVADTSRAARHCYDCGHDDGLPKAARDLYRAVGDRLTGKV